VSAYILRVQSGDTSLLSPLDDPSTTASAVLGSEEYLLRSVGSLGQDHLQPTGHNLADFSLPVLFHS